ncbi:hypothetical protein D3C84_1044940 [compost metagenome]
MLKLYPTTNPGPALRGSTMMPKVSLRYSWSVLTKVSAPLKSTWSIFTSSLASRPVPALNDSGLKTMLRNGAAPNRLMANGSRLALRLNTGGVVPRRSASSRLLTVRRPSPMGSKIGLLPAG